MDLLRRREERTSDVPDRDEAGGLVSLSQLGSLEYALPLVMASFELRVL